MGQLQSHPAVAISVRSQMWGAPPPPPPHTHTSPPWTQRDSPAGAAASTNLASSALSILRSSRPVRPDPSARWEAAKSRGSARPNLPKTRPGETCTSLPGAPGLSRGKPAPPGPAGPGFPRREGDAQHPPQWFGTHLWLPTWKLRGAGAPAGLLGCVCN